VIWESADAMLVDFTIAACAGLKKPNAFKARRIEKSLSARERIVLKFGSRGPFTTVYASWIFPN
jgi:hypothetical protein